MRCISARRAMLQEYIYIYNNIYGIAGSVPVMYTQRLPSAKHLCDEATLL